MGARAIILLVNLVTIPFVVRLLGPTRYGVWALFQSAAVVAIIADVGMGTTSTKFGSERYARGDGPGESAVVWTALSINAVAGGLLALVAAIEAPVIVAHIVHVRGLGAGNDIVALRLICAAFIAQVVMGVVNTPQIVRLRWRPYTLISITMSLIASVGAPVALVLFSGGVETVSAVALLAAVVGAAGNLALAVYLQPTIRHPRFSKAILGNLLQFGGALTLANLAVIPLVVAGRVFLSYGHSAAVVAYYSVAATVGTTLYVLPEQLGAPLLPGLTRLETQGRVAEHRELYGKALSGLYLVIAPAAIMLAFLARPFLTWWAGPAYGQHSTGPFLVIVFGAAVNCVGWVPQSYLLSSGRTKLIAAVDLSLIVPFLIAVYVLSDWLGAVGAAIAWSATLLVSAMCFFVIVKRVAPQLPSSPLTRRRVRSAAAPVLLGGCAAACVLVTPTFATRLAVAACMSLAYAGAVWALVLTNGERDGLVALASQVLRGKPRAGQVTNAV